MPRRIAHLRTMLVSHEPSDATEAQHRQRMLELADAGKRGDLDPFARACFEPGHYTASSFVLGPDQRAVLLILHAKLGFWMQPGGHIEPDDADMIAAARREVAEETGLDQLQTFPPDTRPGFLDLDIHAIPARPGEPGHLHFDLRFLFRSTSAQVGSSDEVLGARWVPLDRVCEVRSDASVARAISRIHHLLRPAPHTP